MSTDVYERLRREVVAALDGEHWADDPETTLVRAVVVRTVDHYQQRARLGDGPALHDPAEMIERLVRSVTDLGALSDLVRRDDVEEIFIEGARVSFLDSDGRLRGLLTPTSEEENRRVVEQLLATTDRQLNATSPLVQARVLGGEARLTAAIPPVADALSATVRRYTVRSVSLRDLVARGALDPGAAAFLDAAMRFRSRVAVSGEPGAGKTTMLAALLAAVPPEHCVRACEEIRELSVSFPHGAYYETRPPALDGSSEITLRQLVKFVLAMRPDRIVVGEVRGAEAFELTRAVNAGCGFLCTVHANSAPEALHALVNAALMAGENVTERVVQRVFSSALDLVVHVERSAAEGGAGIRRCVTEITAVVPALTDGFTCEPVFVRAGPDQPLQWTGAIPDRLEARADRSLGRPGALRSIFESAAA
ncbi:MAG: ATPase, T2SS/T4P/T4SS family [Acidimicrobiia bacterium]|jgi:pilus assembly protein CpaF